MVVSRAGARATTEAQNLLYHSAEKHKEPVEEYCSALCQLVSISVCVFDKMMWWSEPPGGLVKKKKSWPRT